MSLNLIPRRYFLEIIRIYSCFPALNELRYRHKPAWDAGCSQFFRGRVENMIRRARRWGAV
ncbi:MAG TPA: hypothetical protein VHD56_10315, partial [Tepidisphaeraceae bacterium]|nr:hypothetical protein [Tepidisphaeraceae bacterium]